MVRRVGLRDRVAHFTWPWFAMTMSTGAMAVVLDQTPTRFPGLDTIGCVFFVICLTFFVLFNGIMITRFCMAPRKISSSLHHPVEGLFHGTYWVSIGLILNCTVRYGAPKAGPWLNQAIKICFWVYCSISFAVSVIQYNMFFHLERMNITDAVPAWIFPIYPLLVVGTLAGTILPYQPGQSGQTIFIGSVLLQGLAWLVSFLVYGLYMQRLMTGSLPSAKVRPGMFVSVGPTAYTAAGLMSLAKEAPHVVPAGYWTNNSAISDGDMVRILGIFAGSFILLFAYWFFLITTIAVLSGVHRMKFSLTWWSFVFPNAGLTLGTIQLADALNSKALNGLASALTIGIVVMWVFVAGCCASAVFHGDIMWPGKDEDAPIE